VDLPDEHKTDRQDPDDGAQNDMEGELDDGLPPAPNAPPAKSPRLEDPPELGPGMKWADPPLDSPAGLDTRDIAGGTGVDPANNAGAAGVAVAPTGSRQVRFSPGTRFAPDPPTINQGGEQN